LIALRTTQAIVLPQLYIFVHNFNCNKRKRKSRAKG